MAFAPVFRPTFPATFDRSQPAAAAADWWVVAGKTTVAAYQPKGAASLAASYVNLANPGTYDATPVTAPGWSSGNGWEFTAANSHYLSSGITPTSSSWTVLVRYSGVTGDNRGLFGFYAGGYGFLIEVMAASNRMDMYNGLDYPSGYFNVAPALTAGVYGFAGKTAYRDGISDGTIPAGSLTGSNVLIGAITGLGRFFEGYMQAMVIHSDTLTGGEFATVSAAMAAL